MSVASLKDQTVGRSDEELAEVAKAGDHQAFAQLYNRHARRIEAQLCRLTGPGRHVEDLLQQTYLQI